MSYEVNINTATVRIKLKPKGLTFWRARRDAVYATRKIDAPRELYANADGWVSIELWAFIEIFGGNGGYLEEVQPIILIQ
jgi:hypothetical protein